MSYKHLAARTLWRNELDMAEHEVWPLVLGAVSRMTQIISRMEEDMEQLRGLILPSPKVRQLDESIIARKTTLHKSLEAVYRGWDTYVATQHWWMQQQQQWQHAALQPHWDRLPFEARQQRLRDVFSDVLQYTTLYGYEGVRRCVLEIATARLQPTQRLLTELFVSLPYQRDMLLVHRPGSDYLVTACEMLLRQLVLHVLQNRSPINSVDALVLVAQPHSVSAWQQTLLSIVARHPYYLSLLQSATTTATDKYSTAQQLIDRACQVHTFGYSRVVILLMRGCRCVFVLHPFTHELNAPLRAWLEANTAWDLSSQSGERKGALQSHVHRQYRASSVYADAFGVDRDADIDALARSAGRCMRFPVGLPRMPTSVLVVDQGATLVDQTFSWRDVRSSPVTLAWMWALWLRQTQHLSPRTIMLTCSRSLQVQHTTAWHVWSMLQLLEADPLQQESLLWRRRLTLRTSITSSFDRRHAKRLRDVSRRLDEAEEAHFSHKDISQRFHQVVSFVDLAEDDSFMPSSTIIRVPMGAKQRADYTKLLETHRKKMSSLTDIDRFTLIESPVSVARGWGTARRFGEESYAKFNALSVRLNAFGGTKHVVFSYCRRNSYARDTLQSWLHQPSQRVVWEVLTAEQLVTDWLSDECRAEWDQRDSRSESAWMEFMVQRWIRQRQMVVNRRKCFMLYGWSTVEDMRGCERLLHATRDRNVIRGVTAKDFVDLQQQIFNHPLNDDGQFIPALFADPRFVLSLRVRRVSHVHEIEPPSSIGLRELLASAVQFDCSGFSSAHETTYDDRSDVKRGLVFHTYLATLDPQQSSSNEEFLWNTILQPATLSNSDAMLRLVKQISIDRNLHQFHTDNHEADVQHEQQHLIRSSKESNDLNDALDACKAARDSLLRHVQEPEEDLEL